MGNASAVRRVRVTDDLSGSERIRLMLLAKGFRTIAEFAVSAGSNRPAVSMCIHGRRPYPEIRDALAATLGKPRRVIDQLIEATGLDRTD